MGQPSIPGCEVQLSGAARPPPGRRLVRLLNSGGVGAGVPMAARGRANVVRPIPGPKTHRRPGPVRSVHQMGGTRRLGRVLERFAEFTAADADRLFAGQGRFADGFPERRPAGRRGRFAVGTLGRGRFCIWWKRRDGTDHGSWSCWPPPFPDSRIRSQWADITCVSENWPIWRRPSWRPALRSPGRGMDSFPVYPDYMLPRFLRHLGILRYSSRLAQAVDSRIEIPRHSQQEVAIRWATVHVGHRLVEELTRVGVPVDRSPTRLFPVVGGCAGIRGVPHGRTPPDRHLGLLNRMLGADQPRGSGLDLGGDIEAFQHQLVVFLIKADQDGGCRL